VAAFAAFSELVDPVIGMLTRQSLRSRHALLSPVPSFPTTSSVGPVKSASNTARSPCSSAPASTTGHPWARRAASHPATSRCEAQRTTGTLNSEPVLARTDRGSYTSAACPVTMTPCAPNASADRMMLPMLPGLAGRSSTTPRKRSSAGMRLRSSAGNSATATSSGRPSAFSPSSASKSEAMATWTVSMVRSNCSAHSDSGRSAS
jgi:hypothetical protein